MFKKLLSHPLTHGRDLDAPETSNLRKAIIQSKPFLKKIYAEWYQLVLNQLSAKELDGRVIEVGSGAGHLLDVAPTVISSDLMPIDGVQLVIDAQNIPVASGSLSALLMVNVLHHIPDISRFFDEASRCIRPSGKIVMIEPWLTPWSRLVYTKLHHEPLDEQVNEWKILGDGPLSGANSALPWMLFNRDIDKFSKRHLQWDIKEVRPFMPFRYLLSGGISLRSLMPAVTFEFWRGLETALNPWANQLAMFALITLERKNI